MFRERFSNLASKAEKLIELIEPLAQEHDLDLVNIEVAGTRKNPVLRIFLDTQKGGITLDELADAQVWIDEAIENFDPFQQAYTLEVSSPGIDRPLRKLQDFERFSQKQCKIVLKAPISVDGKQAKSTFSGLLLGVLNNDVLLQENAATTKAEKNQEQEKEPLKLAFCDISKANIIGEIDFSKRDDAFED